MKSKADRIDELASRLYDDALTEAEAAELNTLVRDPEGARRFIAFAAMHTALHRDAQRSDDLEVAGAFRRVHEAVLGAPPEPPAVIPQSRFTSRSAWGAIAAALAASLLAVLAWPRGADERPGAARVADAPAPAIPVAPETGARPAASVNKVAPSDPRGYVARVLTASADVQWSEAGRPDDVLMRLAPGTRLEPKRGLVELEFASGATLLLEGPGALEVLGPDRVRLESGRLVGRSEKSDFHVDTPDARVLDVGTVFGVAVDRRSGTEVSVFDGEVRVNPGRAPGSGGAITLTRGMAVRVGLDERVTRGEAADGGFTREAPRSGASVERLSLVDLVAGSSPGESRVAGAIDPRTGDWERSPWLERRGVPSRDGSARYVSVGWNPYIDGVFAPGADGGEVTIDSSGHRFAMAHSCGSTWGPIWARRRLPDDSDPLVNWSNDDPRGFWGIGTREALAERLRWVEDGLVGMFPNVGMTIDLDAVRRAYGREPVRIIGEIGYLEASRDSSPLYPNTRADFQVLVDGKARDRRLGFRRGDGDAPFAAELSPGDRFVTLLSTDGDGANRFDHVVLLNSVLEFKAAR